MQRKNLILLAWIIAFPAFHADVQAQEQQDADMQTLMEIHQLVNAHRQEEGMNSLQWNETLHKAAAEHAEYMVEQKAISHHNFSSRGKSILKTLQGKGISENVAYGYPTPEKLVEGWLSSPGHRKNIEGDYNLTGIAAKTTAEGVIYYCQLFVKK